MFITITELEEITGYRSRKSIRKWLAKELGLPLLRIGRQYCVNGEQYKIAIAKRYQVTVSTPSYRPKHQAEKDFLKSLTSSFTELPCPSNEKEA